ncbi:Spermidine/putrescine-binding periplasmic protein precursor [Marinomonas aquimarina]|uniref:Spermidine/putrescine-binding periplasmic protein n=1 Tax=Marinomonas aquimarina TaxID=295068 RepID=A0A1A8TLZ9_9GAMM|nr:spermidine/putrescine ABC transporter substrate-binding protein [Marinomonas aquimarina]SBS33554.1 Spermidine/putrescine-binding periplasmic protein precursor [Marinomonas aquimarina]
MFSKTIAYGALLFATFMAASTAQARAVTLTLYTWEDYTDPSLLDEWQAETGIAVKQVYFDDEAQRNLVLSGHASEQIDVAVVDSSTIRVLSGAGYLYPVTKQPKRETFLPSSCGAFGRPYLWGSYGLVYREDKLTEPLTSWQSLLTPSSELSGHIGMLGLADELIMPALSALGYSVNSTDERQIQETFKLLKVQSPHVATYDYIYTYVLANPEQQEVWAAPAYSGDQVGLNELQGADVWQYVIPDEGAIIWLDCLAITANSRYKEEAQALIDFLTQKENSAQSTETLWVASPYKDALDLIDEQVLQDPTVYLDSDTLEKAVLFQPLRGSDILKRTRIKDALIRYHDFN